MLVRTVSPVKSHKPETDFLHFDPFTLSEYENIVRIIRIHALENPEVIEARGESFVVRKNILLKDLISVNGVFTAPYTIKSSSTVLRIRKDGYYLEDRNPTSKLITEAECEMLLQREEGEESASWPVMLRCNLAAQNLYMEKTGSTLLSKKRVYIEKHYNHTILTTEHLDEIDYEVIPDEACKIYKYSGFCKVDASTGFVMEER